MRKKMLNVLLAALCLANAPAAVFPSNVITAEAYGGRTDSSGGHHDNKNKSGLGSYHYHCGGHEAHLHTNGVCPYAATTAQFSGGTAKSSVGSTGASVAVPDHIEYVFDAQYYADHNSDIKDACGNDRECLLNHFLTNGMKEGRQAAEGFNLSVYKEKNPDLVQVFGDSNERYYMHYMSSGCSEGRVAQ